MQSRHVDIDWNHYAHCYDALTHLTPYQELQTIVAKTLNVNCTDRVLDAGCGTGNLLAQICTNPIMCVGYDASPEMLALAHTKCCENTTLIQGGLNNRLPFADSTFTKIAFCNVLYSLADPCATLQELVRILIPGGVLVIVNPKPGYDSGMVLKAHTKSDTQDEYWTNPHSSVEREEALIRAAFEDDTLVSRMADVAYYNRLIHSSHAMHFFSADELRDLCCTVGLTPFLCTQVYATQGILLASWKE